MTHPIHTCHDNHDLTETQSQVLDLIAAAPHPATAYQLLDGLREKRGAPVQPPTVYRAINHLVAHGLVHRLESLNAFIACTDHHHAHSSQFAICGKCGKTEELFDDKVVTLLAKRAAAVGFTTTAQTIELRGTCRECAGIT